MLPEDVFNRGFDAIVERLNQDFDALKDVATVEREQAATFWRARVQPHARNACGMELVLHRNQRFDLVVGDETAEGQVIAAFDFFPKLVAALSLGQVVCRTLSAPSTGTPLVRETRVTLDDGTLWSIRRTLVACSSETEREALQADKHFAPYARG